MPIMEDETRHLHHEQQGPARGRACAAPGRDRRRLAQDRGRTKSLYYVARTAQIYRQAIDDAVAGRPFNPLLITELEGLANRGYTSGFLERRPSQDYQNYETGHSLVGHSHYVGDVLAAANSWAEVEVKNKFSVGDKIQVIHRAATTSSNSRKCANLTASRSASRRAARCVCASRCPNNTPARCWPG